jgi:hypothetical protein
MMCVRAAPAPGKYVWGAKAYVRGAYQNHITLTQHLGRKVVYGRVVRSLHIAV